MSEKKPMGTRAKARRAKWRRVQPNRLYLEIGDYLETIGWRAVVMGGAQIRGFETGKIGKYEFVVEFTGGKIQKKADRPDRAPGA